jgi:hypothetical protein
LSPRYGAPRRGELLAILSKIGALYVQSFPDPRVIAAIDDLENLTTGRSREICQKIVILGLRLDGVISGRERRKRERAPRRSARPLPRNEPLELF